MKGLVLVMVIAVLAGLLSPAFAQEKGQQPGTGQGFFISYTEFEGHPVTLHVTNNRNAVLCARADDPGELFRTKALAFLEREVRVHFATLRQQQIGSSGKVFAFGGGYPMWIPLAIPQGQCLWFAENVTVDGDLIKAQGQSERPDSWPRYGYGE